MLQQLRVKRLILTISSQSGVFYAACVPVLAQVKLNAQNPRDAQREAKDALRQALKAHIGAIT